MLRLCCAIMSSQGRDPQAVLQRMLDIAHRDDVVAAQEKTRTHERAP
jgi:hypothetical protein